MKTTMRGSLFVPLAIVSGMAILAGTAQCADEPLPPEVKKLIGMKIPPKRIEGKEINKNLASRERPVPEDYVRLQPAQIPTWSIHYGMIFLPSDSGLSVDELYQNNLSIFAITKYENDKSRIVLDVKVLPQPLLEYFVKSGQLVIKKDAYTNENYYRLNGHCRNERSNTVVALVRPEPNVSMGWSENVKLAWAIDEKTGHIKEISTQGVACFVETGED